MTAQVIQLTDYQENETGENITIGYVREDGESMDVMAAINTRNCDIDSEQAEALANIIISFLEAIHGNDVSFDFVYREDIPDVIDLDQND